MIPARKNNFISFCFSKYLWYRINKAFNRIVVMPVDIKPGHSVLLLSNHFSWWDGFFGGYLATWHFKRRMFIMMQEDHLQKRMFFNWLGGFSIKKTSREALRSLDYAADLLNTPENMVVVFPQGELVSNHATEIIIEKGIERLLKNINGPCQIIYACTLIDYFESLKPSAFIHLLNCGTVGEGTFDELVSKINAFHQQALKDQLNVAH